MAFPIEGLIHEYSFRHIAFEFQPYGSKNVIVFVGGLMGGLLTVPYLEPLSIELAKINYSLIQIEMSSSHIGWGTGSLHRDSDEITQLINYLKSEKGGSRQKIGIMGHSCGCQNSVHYFNVQPRDDEYIPLDFAILQAPVSYRGLVSEILSEEEISESLRIANGLIDSNQPDTIMPNHFCKHFFNVPISAYRWKSLLDKRCDDDFFSADLDDIDFKSTFGKFDKPFLVLYSGDDQYVPDWVDKQDLLNRWANVAGSNWSPFSQVIKGGNHNLGEDSKKGAQKVAINAIINFVKSL